MPEPWYKSAWRRCVIDMHIPDWDGAFLSQFDPDQYVAMLRTAHAQSAVVYAQSHVGLFNYPTKVGKQHEGLRGRDMVAEVLERCHQHDIKVVLYTSLIHDRWAGDNHPDWKIIMQDGNPAGIGGRHAVLCPNSPYRDYVKAFSKELCERYAFDGIRFDMTFWPLVCVCSHCQAKHREATGRDIPRTIDWRDEKWVAFQRLRETWMAQFGEDVTSVVRKHRPEATVEHQASTFPLHWQFGVAEPLAPANDFLQGDFYGDSWHGSFARKVLEAFSPNGPIGFETSFAVSLQDHTTMKSADLLEAKASAALADGAAFVFIDAIDPIGTLNPRVYQRMGSVFERLLPYYTELGGERIADVAIFYSARSKFDLGIQRPLGQPDHSDAHTTSALAFCRVLASHHRPFRIVTHKDLGGLSSVRLVILPQVCHLDADEAEALRTHVRDGGKLLVTGWTSLVDATGRQHANFQLADVLGVSIVEPHWSPEIYYLAPTETLTELFGGQSVKYPIYQRTSRMVIRSNGESQALANVVLPWPASNASRFSSIHSNPPWNTTDEPAIVEHGFGKGTVIYCAGPFETSEHHGELTMGLVRRLLPHSPVESTGPACVELTAFHQPDRHRYIVCLVNFQRDLPNIPVDGIEVTLRLPGAKVQGIKRIPDRSTVPHTARDDAVVFTADRLETLGMYVVEIC